VDNDLPSSRSPGIWFYLAFNLNARLYARGEKEIEYLSVDLALANCTLNNPRAVPDEEEDDSAAGAFVLEPSSDEYLFAVQATRENILDPDSFLQPNTPDERAEGREWII
jgi:hypothetical protein